MAIIRFFFVSAGGVFVDITIAYAIATMLGTPLWIAAAVGFSVAACGNYILHEIWTLNTIARFPVRLEEGLTTELGVSVVNDSSANEAFRILSCSAAAVPMEFDFLFQKRGSGLYVTDENWDESIARRWAGFIVKNIRPTGSPLWSVNAWISETERHVQLFVQRTRGLSSAFFLTGKY
jgi:hypothetical protein